jgi:L-asparaginase II
MDNYRAGVRLVELRRCGIVESTHTGHVAVIDASGQVRRRAGHPDGTFFARSALKPLQALGMLRARWRPDDDGDLALACASHVGSPVHRERVATALAAAGLGEDDLGCPPELPMGTAEQRAHLAAGLGPSRLAMNCSGKHAAMLRTCLTNGWPTATYLDRDHPLQQALAATVAEACGEPIAATAVDGCGAPLFGLSLTGIARAYARLATATSGPERAVAAAMQAHPVLVEGEDEAVTRLLRAVPGLVAKDGAEGVFAAGLPDGTGVALKIDDGATRAADAAMAQVLRELGVRAEVLDALVTAPVLGGGVPVGELRALPLP